MVRCEKEGREGGITVVIMMTRGIPLTGKGVGEESSCFIGDHPSPSSGRHRKEEPTISLNPSQVKWRGRNESSSNLPTGSS